MQKVILAKKELVYGTDAGPTPAANAVLTRNFSAEPLVADTIERKLDLPTRGRVKAGRSNRRTTFGFEVELAGSGAAATPAAWMELLEACGMAPPTVDAANTFISQKFAAEGVQLSSLTCYHWIGGERVRPFGARGTFGLDFTAGAYPFAKIDLTGLLPAIAVDQAAPAAASVLARWKEPLEVNTVNTDFFLDGFAVPLKSFTLDVNADVKLRNLVGANYVQRGDHAITGRITCEAPSLAVRNYYNVLDVGSEIAVQVVHGVAAGSFVTLDALYLEITKITRTIEDDKLMLDISYGANIRNGQDDLLLVSR